MVIAREGYATTVDKFTTDDNGEITKTYTLKLALVTYSVTTLFDDTKGKLAARPSTGVTKDALVELTIKPNTGYQLTEVSL